MTIEIIDLNAAKRALAVTHTHRDDYIQEKLEGACFEVECYLDKTLFETPELMASSIESGNVSAERSMVVNPDIKNAAACLVKYHYDGASSFQAEKNREAAFNILDKYRLITA